MPHALELGCQTNPPGSNLIPLGALSAPSPSQVAFGQTPNKTAISISRSAWRGADVLRPVLVAGSIEEEEEEFT